MKSRFPPLSTAAYVWRFLTIVMAVLGVIAIGVTYAWHYWYIVRYDGYDWCYYQGPNGGLNDATEAIVTWWPLGVTCSYMQGETYQLPGWGPTYLVLAGFLAVFTAVGTVVAQTVSRRHRSSETYP